ncbi:hypothetical protein MNEG_1559 [Monoraphidium neglectum]|uniref:Nudix hydrolase domain-containing protein n=1 Tax=Monoraphidium neglectum TaxID=145388 RepID=A0A0D2K840_9CHLO|nr:hypothetical protein MNEG_1559 [Monoraphidium neglectum]KIZ06398.1 hypothetical protein MNEG_1559 [Monoraphidium neglectum]|eukprot:XP_013905417.1 hypothetical protein MNEG_1559 [Monoraphidium neglectum]
MPTSVGGPAPISSRQGRDKQRYTEDGARLVAGCIPIRYKGAPGCAGDVEVLLITSRGGKGWVFPKGGWEDDESVESAAKRETVEEAGVRGAIEVSLPEASVICRHQWMRDALQTLAQSRGWDLGTAGGQGDAAGPPGAQFDSGSASL